MLTPVHTCQHLSPTEIIVGDKNACQSKHADGGWAWLTSIMLAVIGRPSKNVGLQFGEMSATNAADVFASATKCEQAIRDETRLITTRSTYVSSR